MIKQNNFYINILLNNFLFIFPKLYFMFYFLLFNFYLSLKAVICFTANKTLLQNLISLFKLYKKLLVKISLALNIIIRISLEKLS